MNVSPFLYKTFNLVSDPSTDSIISWSADGTSFVVHRPDLSAHKTGPFSPEGQRWLFQRSAVTRDLQSGGGTALSCRVEI